MINERRSAFGLESLRRPAFYVAVIGSLGLFAVMLQDLLPLVIMAWYVDIGPHRFHDLNFLAMVWLGLLGLLVQLFEPADRVNAAVVPVLVMGPLAIMALTTGSPIAMLPVVFTALGFVVLALHPAGRSVLQLEPVTPVDRGLLGLVALAAIPLTVYAVTEFSRQYAVADEHAAFVHYGAMALVSAMIVVFGLLATVRRRDWRFAAWAAGGLAVYLGASSFTFPSYASSAGPFWGGLAVAWGVGFVAAAEVTRGRTATVHIEHATVIDAPRERLWALVNDFDRMTDWVTFADELTYLSEGPIGEGTVYREVGGIGPMASESEWEITVFEPPTRQAHVGDLGIMKPELTMTFEEHDGATRFTQELRFRALPRASALGWLLEQLVIKRAMQSGLRETQRNLKRLAEAEA